MKNLIKNIILGLILTALVLGTIFIVGSIFTFLVEHLSLGVFIAVLFAIFFILHLILD